MARLLKSVKVYASGAGTRTIQLLDNAGTLVDTRTVNVPNGESRITLDMNIEPGTQYLLKLTGTGLNLYRNNAGASFPYAVGGMVSITGTNATGAAASTYYYYFYDWEVHTRGCTSARSAVTAEVVVCTGVEDADATGVIVRPNPSASGAFMIMWEGFGDNPTHLMVHDASGRLVKEMSVAGFTSRALQLDEAYGVYFLRLTDEHGGSLLDRKLVVGP